MHDLVMHVIVIQVYMPTSYLEDRDVKMKNIIPAKGLSEQGKWFKVLYIYSFPELSGWNTEMRYDWIMEMCGCDFITVWLDVARSLGGAFACIIYILNYIIIMPI